MRLSSVQREMLEYAATLPVDGIELAMPDGIGQVSACAALVRRGLLQHGGVCRHVDSGREGDGYEITDAGRAAIANHEDQP